MSVLGAAEYSFCDIRSEVEGGACSGLIADACGPDFPIETRLARGSDCVLQGRSDRAKGYVCGFLENHVFTEQAASTYAACRFLGV